MLFYWAWGHDGVPLSQTVSRPCASEALWTQSVLPLHDLGETLAPSLKTTPCGEVAFATYDPTAPIVSRLATSLWDADAIVAARVKAIAAVEAASQKQQNNALDKANKNKPML